MFRLVLVLFLLLQCTLPVSVMSQSVSAPPPLERVRALYNEKSWQLAVDAVDEADTASLTQDARRELEYLKSAARKQLNPHDVSVDKPLEALIDKNPRDVWAAYAHWKLQHGLGEGRWLDVNTSDPLRHLRAAEHILVDIKSSDLARLYREVVDSNLMMMRFAEKADSDYALSFFDKLTPLLQGNEDLIADVLLRKQDALNATEDDRPAEAQLAGWRGIVAEFPRTRAAARAQMNVCQYYVAQKDYVAALYELNMLTNRFAGTEEAKNAAAEIERIKRPEAVFSLTSQFYPGEKIEFAVTARNARSAKLSVVPYDLVAALKKQEFTRPELEKATGKPVHSQTVNLETNDKYLPTTKTVLLDYSKAGMYVLRAEVNGKVTCSALLLISDLALVGNLGSGAAGYEFWTVDAKTGKPRQGANVTIAHSAETKNRWLSGERIQFFSQFADLTTDQNGFANFVEDDAKHGAIAIARSGDNVAFMENVYWSPFERAGRTRPIGYLYTDRPVYRPEQKVYWRAIVRNKVDGNYQVPAAEKYSVLVRDAKNQELYKADNLALSEFGTLSGEVDIAVGAPLGGYNITVTRAADSQTIVNHNFQVEEYKKPEFEVSVEAASDFAKVGQEVTARVEAKYLFGAPVSDGTVKYTVRRRPRFQIMWDRMTWHLEDRDLGWFDSTPERPPTLHGSSGVIVAQGESKLTPDGSFELKFISTVPDDELKALDGPQPLRGMRSYIWPPAPRAWDFQVEVTVTDASRRNIDASQVIPVGLKALKLASKTQRNIVSPGDNARVELKSMNLADKPLSTSGTLYVEKLVWSESAKEDDITTVSEQAVTIESSGSLVINWRVPQDVSGRLRFAYITDDPYGGKSVTYANFYAVSADEKDVATQYQGIEIVADKTVYTVGDTARLMILSEYKDAYIWYWEDVGSGSLRKQVMPLPHRTNFVSIPITRAYVPNAMVHVVGVREKKLISDEVELIVPPASQVINVSVTPANKQVEPGQSGLVTLNAADENGEPVRAELSLSIFDQAITYIVPDTRPDIRKALYGMKRGLRSSLQHSLDLAGMYELRTYQDTYQYMFTGDDAAGNGVMRYYAGHAAPQKVARAAGTMEMAVAAPAMAPPSASMDMVMSESSGSAMKLAMPADEEAKAGEAPVIRSDFRDSMFWSPAVMTDADGSATVQIKYPDSLTTWRMVAVGLTSDTRVGNTTTETVARKKIMARLQAPRFFRERDELTLSANLHNYTNSAVEIDATLRAKGIALAGAQPLPLNGDSGFQGNSQKVTVPAGGEARVDWKVKVESAAPGEAVLNLAALSVAGSDSIQTTVPLLAHGIDKFVAWNGTSEDSSSTGVQVETSGTVKTITQTVNLPAERIKETTRLDITVNPSLASSIREAIPYMIDYPYGCVEQTMSRFMPAAVAARTFQVLGYPLDKSLQDRLPKVTQDGLKRLRDMQLPQGGWGWWAADSENLQMTAYVMQGLTMARDAEVTVDADMFDRGLLRLAHLRSQHTSETVEAKSKGWWYGSNLHNLVYAEYVLALNGKASDDTINLIWERRDELTARGLAMLARTMFKLGRQADAELVLRNLHNKAVPEPINGTLRWGKPESNWWYEDAVEATAVGLMAYLEIKPDDPAVEQAMKWLVLNRQGNRWKSTRDTAHGVLALTQYMLTKNEAAKPVKIEVYAGDKLVKTLDVKPENFWDFDGRITLRGAEIPDGDFPVKFVVSGEGKMYYSIFAEYFTLEEHIKQAGNEIFVTRTYEKLNRERTTETVSGSPRETYKDTWLPLKDGGALKSGDEVRVSLRIKSLNDYEYIIVEDPKPAGMEPVDLVSGSRYGNGLCSNMELRDKWIAFFITTLRQGEHTLTYNMRAEIPGTFHAMPATGAAMYFPPLRTNSDEVIMTIED